MGGGQALNACACEFAHFLSPVGRLLSCQPFDEALANITLDAGPQRCCASYDHDSQPSEKGAVCWRQHDDFKPKLLR